MRSASGSQPLLFDPEIERFCRTNRKRIRARTIIMAEGEDNQRTLRDYFKPVVQDNYSGIQCQIHLVAETETKQHGATESIW